MLAVTTESNGKFFSFPFPSAIQSAYLLALLLNSPLTAYSTFFTCGLIEVVVSTFS